MTTMPDVDAVLPLTPAQQGLLLHSVANPELGVYVNQVVITLSGPLDPARLRESWAEAVGRHEVLRTAFLWEDLDQPLQAVRRGVRLPWTEQDWRDRTAEDRDRTLAEHLDRDRATPFSLTRAPLMRLLLVRAADEQWWLVWTHHHLLLDGWAMTIVLDEVFARYRGGGDERTAPPYRDYVAWLHDQNPAAAETFWRQRLSGFDGRTPLPAARQEPTGDAEFGDVAIGLSEEEYTGLREFCREHRLTVGTVVQGAWALVLSRYSGRAHVVFGSVVSGRSAEVPGIESMVGLLSNTLPVPVTVDPARDVVDWLTELQRDLADARQDEHTSLSRIARWAGAAGAAALFDTIVAWENYPNRGEWQRGTDGIAVSGLRFLERPHYPVTVTAAAGTRLELFLQVDFRWYDRDAIAAVAEYLRGVLGALASGRGGTLGALLGPSAAERALVDRWSGDGDVPPVSRRVAGFGAEETADQAARLAGYLEALGVGAEDLVAVCLPPSADRTVALHAVAHAGATAVPLDPGLPPARLTALLGMSGSRCLLTSTATRPATGLPVVLLDDEDLLATIAVRDPAPPAPVGPDSALYLVHTTGSGHGPVGVLVTHRGVLAAGVLEPCWSLMASGTDSLGAAETTGVAMRDGRPVSGARCVVLDEDLRPVPPGVPGEVHVGGAVLARGYRDAPGRTAASFVPDPCGPAGARLWRTGRRARWRIDGTLELLGDVARTVSVAAQAERRPAPFAAAGTEAERVLAAIWAELLDVPRVGVHDNFFELGGDSITSLLVVSRAAKAGLRITARQFLDHQTVAGLAAVAERVATPVGVHDRGTAGEVALTPVQHWFFEHELARPGHWNLNVSLAIVGDVATDVLAEWLVPVLAAVVDRHDALRTRFHRDAGGRWTARNVPAAEAVAAVSLVSVRDRPDWAAAVDETARAAQEFDLGTAPLLRAVVVDGGAADRRRLLLVAHHLVVDGVSWRVLLSDLETGLRQVAARQPVRLPPAGTTNAAWADALVALADAPEVLAELDFWRAQQVGGADLPVDLPDAPDHAVEAAVRHIEVELTVADTDRLLRLVPRAYRTHVDDVLLTAFGRAVATRTGRTGLLLALESHGRDDDLVRDAELAETVGWLTAIAPVYLTLPRPDEDLGASLVAVKEQLRAVPRRGLGYGLLRHLNQRTGDELARLPRPAVSFNNLGRFDTGIDPDAKDAGGLVFRPAPEAHPPAHHHDNRRPHLLDVNLVTQDGRLRLAFSYSPEHHTEATVRGLAEETVAQLRALIEHCVARTRPVSTPSDFPESGLDQRQLDTLLADVERLG